MTVSFPAFFSHPNSTPNLRTCVARPACPACPACPAMPVADVPECSRGAGQSGERRELLHGSFLCMPSGHSYDAHVAYEHALVLFWRAPRTHVRGTTGTTCTPSAHPQSLSPLLPRSHTLPPKPPTGRHRHIPVTLPSSSFVARSNRSLSTLPPDVLLMLNCARCARSSLAK